MSTPGDGAEDTPTAQTLADPLAWTAEDPADFAALRARIVADVDNSFTRGERRFAVFFGRKADFAEHMNELRSEFIGQSELLFAHAALVVALRRKMDTERNLASFEALWRAEGTYLRQNLSLRWLVSACDTLADYGTATQRAMSLISVFLVNTVKLYETERHVAGLRTKEVDVVAAPAGFLFDGLTCFSISEGDMIANMMRRATALALQDDIVGPILIELLRRLGEHPTVFRRFSELRNAATANPQRYPKIAPRKRSQVKLI